MDAIPYLKIGDEESRLMIRLTAPDKDEERTVYMKPKK